MCAFGTSKWKQISYLKISDLKQLMQYNEKNETEIEKETVSESGYGWDDVGCWVDGISLRAGLMQKVHTEHFGRMDLKGTLKICCIWCNFPLQFLKEALETCTYAIWMFLELLFECI